MTDLEFVQNCCSHEKKCWNEFNQRYSRLIYSYINRIFRLKGVSLTGDLSDDICHEIFVVLSENNFKRLSSFKAKNGCSLATWLRQVTVNYCLSYIRKMKPLISLEEERESGLTLKDTLKSSTKSSPEIIHEKEALKSLDECVNKLEDKDRHFVDLFYRQNRTFEDLGRLFNVSRPSIDMRKFRIIAKLKDCFRLKGFALDL